MDTGCGLGSLLKEPNCDPLQSLPSESTIKIVDSELNRLAQNSVEIVEMMPIFLRFLLDPLC